jgi:A/G-specific adenine glycosylase
MLQQTRVSVVVPRYELFLRRFPDPTAMADAPEEAVLAAWSGLGYYRRARNLHAAAKAIVKRHGVALPGVGDYTAGAVSSIAFGRPEPIVDGNVERVLARLFLVRGNVKRGAAKKRLWALARKIAAAGPPAEVNQSVMELGALVCAPKSPSCLVCPVRDHCGAHRTGRVERLPERPKRRVPIDVQLAVALVTDGRSVLLARAPSGGFLAGVWGPPFVETPARGDPREILMAETRRRFDLDLDVGAELGTVKHTITHHRIRAHCFEARAVGDATAESLRWVEDGELGAYGLSALARKSLSLHMR